MSMTLRTLHSSISHLLHRASQAAEALFEAKTNGLTSRQLVILDSVSSSEGLSQVAIVAATGIDRSTTADIVRRMCRRGLLRRKRSRTDSRAYNVVLTDMGRKMLADGALRMKAVDEALLAKLEKDQRSTLLEGLALISLARADQAPASAPSLRWLTAKLGGNA
jgi:DNA-binding MarR family transcriptional regulator